MLWTDWAHIRPEHGEQVRHRRPARGHTPPKMKEESEYHDGTWGKTRFLVLNTLTSICFVPFKSASWYALLFRFFRIRPPIFSIKGEMNMTIVGSCLPSIEYQLKGHPVEFTETRNDQFILEFVCLQLEQQSYLSWLDRLSCQRVHYTAGVLLCMIQRVHFIDTACLMKRRRKGHHVEFTETWIETLESKFLMTSCP